MREKIINSLSWQMINKVCSMGMNLMIQIILARLVEPKEFGKLAIITTVITFLNIFVESGISTALIQKRELQAEDAYTVQMISLAIAFVMCCILIGAAPAIGRFYNSEDLIFPLRVLSILLVFNSINSVFTALLIRELEFKKMFIRTVISVPISGLLGIILAYLGYGIWALAIYQLVNAAITSAILVFTSDIKFLGRISIKRAKEIYSFGSKILFTGIVNSFYDTVRTMLIGHKYSKSELAYYDRAYTYSRYSVQIVNTSIANIILPVFSKKQDERQELKDLARKAVGLSAFVMFPVLVGLAAVAKPLFFVFLTAKWEASIPFFIVFCFLRIPGVITSIDKQLFFSIGRSDIVLKYSILALLLNIGLLYFVLPFGVLAIAVNTMIVEWLMSLVLMVFSSKLIGYSIKEKIEDLWKPMLNSAVMFLAIYACFSFGNINMYKLLLIQTIVGIITYIGMSCITRNENLKVILFFLKERRHEKSEV